MDRGARKAAAHGVAKSWTWLSDFPFTFHFHALEKEMATHSSVLAWRISGTGEPGGLLSIELHRVGHDWSNLAASSSPAFIHTVSATWHIHASLQVGSYPWLRSVSGAVYFMGCVFIAICMRSLWMAASWESDSMDSGARLPGCISHVWSDDDTNNCTDFWDSVRKYLYNINIAFFTRLELNKYF